jgi:phage terminase Nu1 subunit (DNA packaging protein)
MPTVSHREFAALVGAKSHRSVGTWIESGACPTECIDSGGRLRRDRLDGALDAWRDRAERTNQAGSDRGGKSEYMKARTRHALARAALAEFELERELGKYVLVAEARGDVEKIFRECRDKLLGLATRIRQQMPNVAHADVARIDDLVREALEALADGREPWAA